MPHKYILKSHFNTDNKFRIDYATELTAEQLAVATAAPGPMLVIAGAGEISQSLKPCFPISCLY